MNSQNHDFRDKVLDAALQLIFATGVIEGGELNGKTSRKINALGLDVDSIKRMPIRSWANHSFKVRRRREANFGPTLFSDPAWDILLQVLISDLDGKPLTVSNASVVADTPMTTGLRWINRLEEAGLVQRVADPKDRRIIWVRLTARALQHVAAHFGDEMEMLTNLVDNEKSAPAMNSDCDNDVG